MHTSSVYGAEVGGIFPSMYGDEASKLDRTFVCIRLGRVSMDGQTRPAMSMDRLSCILGCFDADSSGGSSGHRRVLSGVVYVDSRSDYSTLQHIGVDNFHFPRLLFPTHRHIYYPSTISFGSTVTSTTSTSYISIIYLLHLYHLPPTSTTWLPITPQPIWWILPPFLSSLRMSSRSGL